MSPVAVSDAAPVGFHAKNLRVLLSEPGRRSCRWSSKDTHNVVLRGGGDAALEPIQIIVPFRRLQPAPAEFRNPDNLDIRDFHELQVFFPARLWPLLRIPGCTHKNGVMFGNLRWQGPLPLGFHPSGGN